MQNNNKTNNKYININFDNIDIKLILKMILLSCIIIAALAIFFLQTYSLKFNNATNNDKEVLYTSAKISDEDLLTLIKLGNISNVERILSLGANPNAVDNIQRNAMILAAMFNSKSSIINILKKYGVNINHQDINGYNALMMSILSGGNNNDFSNKLIKEGIDINAKTNSGISVLMVAVGSSNDEKVIENLLKAGANVNYKNNENVTPLMVAAKITTNPKIIDLLLKYGANKNDKDNIGISIYEIARSNPYINKNKTLLNKLK